jgi:carbon-monoxide dehydrogenase medium subunit
MKQRAIFFPYLVDLQAIPNLNRISREDGRIRIGAMATHRSIECSPLVRRSLPVLSEALAQVGNVRVRETASLGGNLAHADCRLDPPPALLILDADLVLFGPNGTRTVRLRDFYRGMYETALEPGEILVEVRIPSMPAGSEAVYLKYSSLSANDWPCLGVAALLALKGNRIQELKLGLSGLASTPVFVQGLDFVRGRTLTDSLLEQLSTVVDEQVSPPSDIRGSEWYKRRMARLFVTRAIRELEARLSA